MDAKFPVMVFFTMKECNYNIHGPGIIRIGDLSTKKTVGTIKVSRLLDTFLYLQENLLHQFRECKRIPQSSQCFGFYWNGNDICLEESVELLLCLFELKEAVSVYDSKPCRK